MDEQMKGSLTGIIGLLVGCGLLVAALAYLFGGSPAEPTLTIDYEEVTIEEPLDVTQQSDYEPMNTNNSNPVAQITTNYGVIELELFDDSMPITAGNFMKLAREGFYDGTKFHRVIDGFMIQGGDPNSKSDEVMTYGTGGPGYAIPDEHIAGDKLTNLRGTIAMANSGPESGGSQFFINLNDNTNLDYDKPPLTSQHPVFGQVISGMDVVDEIATVETGQRDIPTDAVIVEGVVIKE